MRKTEAQNSEFLNEMFCHDWNIPCDVFDGEKFKDRLSLFAEVSGKTDMDKRYEDFLNNVMKYNTVYDYISTVMNAKSLMEMDIARLYRDIVNDSPTDYPMQRKYLYDFGDNPFDKKTFVAIRIKNALFHALKRLTSGFTNYKSWEDFVQIYAGDNPHLLKSGVFDDVIANAIGYEEAQRLTGILVRFICNELIVRQPSINGHVYFNSFIAWNSGDKACEEILIELGDDVAISMNDLKSAVENTVKPDIQEDTEIVTLKQYKMYDEMGTMRMVNKPDGMYAEFPTVNPHKIHLVMCYYSGREIKNDDLLFSHEDFGLCRMMTPIDNPIPSYVSYPGSYTHWF